MLLHYRCLLFYTIIIYFNKCVGLHNDSNKYNFNGTLEVDPVKKNVELLSKTINLSVGIDQLVNFTDILKGSGASSGISIVLDSKQPNSTDTMDTRRFNKQEMLRIKNNYPPYIIKPKNTRLTANSRTNITDTLNYPYMAAIIINGRLWCAGAIVDTNWVVTAAHCLNYVLHIAPLKSLGKFVKIRVGSVHPHEWGELVGVAGAVRHPKFEEEPVPHADVALLKLEEDLAFNSFISLIKIYDGMAEPYAQSFVVVSGWGATRSSDTAFRDHTPDLMSARLKVRTQNYCIDAYQMVNGFYFTDDFFCASLRNGTRDACLFDAGAPAVQKNLLMGIMSFGPERCGEGQQPAVFVKAFYFRDFVKHTIASYKTAGDLIYAIEEMEPSVRKDPRPSPDH